MPGCVHFASLVPLGNLMFRHSPPRDLFARCAARPKATHFKLCTLPALVRPGRHGSQVRCDAEEAGCREGTEEAGGRGCTEEAGGTGHRGWHRLSGWHWARELHFGQPPGCAQLGRLGAGRHAICTGCTELQPVQSALLAGLRRLLARGTGVVGSPAQLVCIAAHACY